MERERVSIVNSSGLENVIFIEAPVMFTTRLVELSIFELEKNSTKHGPMLAVGPVARLTGMFSDSLL